MAVPTQRTGVNPVKINADLHGPIAMLRFRRIARELRLTDQILSTDIDSLTLVEGGPAIAWTSPDGADVTINVDKMPGLHERRDIAVWLGTNAHELLHNQFTPRSGSLLMRRIGAANHSTDPGIHRSWNVLEDQRIERIGLARYAAWRGYLIAALSHHIPVSHSEAWTLVAGRTWLPDEARAIARAAFVATNDETSARKCAELIGAYQRLADPGEADANEAFQIVSEFHGLFGQQLPPRGGCGGHVIKDGEAEPVYDDECPWPTADEADDEADDESGSDDDDGDDDGDEPDDEASDGSDDDGDDGDESGDDGDGESDEGDDESDDGDGSGDGDGDDGDSESDGDGDGESDGEGDGGDIDGESDDKADGEPGDGTSGPDGTRSITEAIDDAIDEALDDDDTAADLDRVVDNLAHGATGGGADLPRKTGEWREATDKARQLARDVTAVLSDIKDDCEASWIRRTDSGRFSVDRWATDPDWDEDNIFDRFDPGAMDASSLDLVLVLDVSGSMSGQNQRLAEATWAIRHAVDRVEGTVTCIGFGDDASLLFDAGQRPDGRIFLPHLEGSTDATGALREAHRLVSDSQATNRIVLVLTDGQWWNAGKAFKALAAAGAAGATTCVVGLGKDGKCVTPGFGGAQLTAHIMDSSELVPIFRLLAERSMRAAAGR